MRALSNIFVFTLIFEHFLNVPIARDGVALSILVLGLGVAAYVSKAIALKDKTLLLPVTQTIHIFVIALLVIMVVSLSNSRNYEMSFNLLQRFSYCVLIYFFILYVVRRLGDFDRIWKWMFAAYVVSAVLGIVEAYTGDDIYRFFGGRSLLGAPVSQNVLMMSDPGRIHGPVHDPEFHSGRMLVFFFMSMAFLFTSNTNWKKFLTVGLIFLAIGNILGAAFKGAVPALFIGLVVFLVPVKNRWKWPLVIMSPIFIICGGLLLGMMFPKVPVGRLVGIGGSYEDRIEFRKNNILIAIEMGLDHPIIGNGPNGFFIRYSDYAKRIPGARLRGIKAHNTYAQVFAEFGVLGLGVFLSIVGWTVIRMGNMVRLIDGPRKYQCLVLLAGICAHLVLMAGSNFLTDQNFWLLLGLSWCLVNALEERESKKGLESHSGEKNADMPKRFFSFNRPRSYYR